MSLESASYIGQLQVSNPTRQDPINQGDDHLKLIKSVLQVQFPGVSGTGFGKAITATEDELNFVHGVTSSIQTQLTRVQNACPIGMIAMWSGVTAPSGWQICDGTNSTPDLRGMFIMGTSSTHALNTTGGSADSIVPLHNHAATASATHTLVTTTEDASHTHSFTTATESNAHTHTYLKVTGSGGIQSGSGLGQQQDVTGDPDALHTHSGTTNGESNNHIHYVNGTISVSPTVNNAGISATNGNLPPYYVLAYIMLMA